MITDKERLDWLLLRIIVSDRKVMIDPLPQFTSRQDLVLRRAMIDSAMRPRRTDDR